MTMENEQKQPNYKGNPAYSNVVTTPVYVAPAPKKDCKCPLDAPCRLNKICACDLAALTLRLKREAEEKAKIK